MGECINGHALVQWNMAQEKKRATDKSYLQKDNKLSSCLLC